MELSVHVNDKLKLYRKTYLSSYHHEVVNLLYQPVMGIEASSLYFTLWDFVNIEKGELIISHRQLLTFFNWSLEKLIQVREKLEAIGLLTIYYHQNEGYYIYELKQPLNAKQFFLDSNLNVHLLYQVGDNLYEYLEKKFMIRPLEKSLVNITRNFHDIYQIIDGVKTIDEDKQYVTSTVNHFSVPLNYDFDFELFSLFVNRSFVNTDLMTNSVKEAIVKEAALYQFDALMMSKIVLACVNDHEIDLDCLHKTTREFYKRLKTKSSLTEHMKPAMTEKEFSLYMNKKRLTGKEKAIKNYKTKTPQEWLSQLQGNTEVPSSMLEVVKALWDNYKLPSEVINVLIEFVRIRNDGRLPLEYTKTIASTWAFNQVSTAEAAMEMVEKIQNKEKEYTKRGEVAPTYRYKKPKRVETEPVWMKEHQEYSNSQKDKQSDESVDIDELKKLLESFK
ncbi:DnaD domain protein [Mycoplasmatota bacterium]|nr:DnaD domain protein [Mycoplasmatota bacterium]